MNKSFMYGLMVFLVIGSLFFPFSNVQASDTFGDSQANSAFSSETTSLPGAALLGAAKIQMKFIRDSLQSDASVTVLPVKTETVAVFSTFLDGTERIAQVYLPGDYAANPDQYYPVLYALDGQQLPDMNFGQTLADLFSSGEITPFITVAVFTTDGDQRREELGTGNTLNLFGWGTQSDAFNQYLVKELVPKINATYRVMPGAENSAIMGWSLGGLTSFYLAWQYPDTFSKVGAFSPSFWSRIESLPGEELQARIIPNLVQSSPARPGMKMWFEAGTKELPYSDIDGNGVIDMIQDVQDVMNLLAQKGYQMNTDMTYIQVEGGQHELSTWETVMPDFLRFAFPVI